MIWASPSHVTFAIWVRVRIRVTGDAHFTRVLGIGMPKTRRCPYHCESAKKMGVSFLRLFKGRAVLKRTAK